MERSSKELEAILTEKESQLDAVTEELKEYKGMVHGYQRAMFALYNTSTNYNDFRAEFIEFVNDELELIKEFKK
jgi:hypothetical protein